MNNPILKSTLPIRECERAPEEAPAVIWAASVAAATAAGMPEKMSSGVMRKPPPTPNRPERNPTSAPIPAMRRGFAAT